MKVKNIMEKYAERNNQKTKNNQTKYYTKYRRNAFPDMISGILCNHPDGNILNAMNNEFFLLT